MNAADIYTRARLAGDNEELWLVVAAAIDALEAKAEPFFSKDLHDHGVLALARVTRERDDAQIALKASKLVAEIAEEGLVRWKREAETAKAEIARLQGYNAALADKITRLAPRRAAEVARLQRENSDLNHNIVGMRSSNTNLVAERDAAKAEIARLEAENQRFKALIESETAWLRSLEPGKSASSTHDPAWIEGKDISGIPYWHRRIGDRVEITTVNPFPTDPGELVSYVEFTDGTSLMGAEADAALKSDTGEKP